MLADGERVSEAQLAAPVVIGGHRQQLDGTRILDGHGDDELKPVVLVLGGRPRSDRRVRPHP
jgi:hypothetical protein